MNPQEFFDVKFSNKVHANPSLLAAAGLRNQTLSLELEGAQGGAWSFAFDGEGKLQISKGTSHAACTISMKDETFMGLLAGKVNVPMAVFTRKIKIKGESSLAAKLGMALQKVFANT